MNIEQCPHCEHTWLGDEIPEGLMAGNPEYYPTRQKAEADAEHYGWTPENHRRFNENVIGIETARYDGISYWLCLKCGTFFDRFTGEALVPVDLSKEDWVAIHQWIEAGK